MTQVQKLQRFLQCGEAERLAESLQVVVVEDEFGQAAEVADGSRELLDVVVAEVEYPEPLQSQHAHVHPGELAVRDLQLLQRIREAGCQRVVLLGCDGQLLFGFLNIFCTNCGQGGKSEAVRVAAAVCQPGGRKEVLQAVDVGLK